MTTVHLIRHGKATPGKESYDELHPVGQAQARALGEYFRAQAQRFDAVYCGPLQRQRDTQLLMREAAGDVGASWSEVTLLDGLAEAPIEAVVRQCVPERLQTDAKLQTLAAALGDGTDKARYKTGLEAVLDYVVDLWSTGELARPGIETAAAFGARVSATLEEILAREGEGRQVAVVTSNGVIGWVVSQLAGSAEPERAGPRQRFWNSSRTRLAWRSGRLSMEASNLVDHLPDGELHTFI